MGSGPQSVRIGSVDATQEITEASFEIPEEWDYAYLEIEDRFGKRAWTNSLFYTPQPVQETRENRSEKKQEGGKTEDYCRQSGQRRPPPAFL